MKTRHHGLPSILRMALVASYALLLISCGQGSSDEGQATVESAAPPPEMAGGLGAPPEGAPPEGAPPQGGPSRTDQVMAAISDLSEQQSALVREILQGSEDAVRNLQSSMPEWNAESMAAINKVWDQEAEKLHGVLSESQQAEYDSWVSAWLAERARDEH